MALQESGEMYLETIYVLSKTSNAVRGMILQIIWGIQSRPSAALSDYLKTKDL